MGGGCGVVLVYDVRGWGMGSSIASFNVGYMGLGVDVYDAVS